MITTINNEHKKLNAPNKQEQNQTCLDAAEREGLRPKGNIPNLRFPEFQEEWEKCKLGTLTAKVGSGSTPKGGNTVYTSTGHCFVRSQNVGMGYLILDDVAHINDGIHQKHKATELKEDDVLLNITGASIGRTAIATKEIEGGNVNQHVCIIRANSKVSPKFLCNYIQTKKIQNYIQSLQTGGSREGLNFEQIRSFPISLPNIAEQNKIAQLLDKLNERIATQSKIIDKLQSLIKGLRVRLIQIENGNIVHLGEIARIYQPQTISSTELTEDGFLVYGANGIIGKYKEYNHKTEQICITCRGNTCGMVNYSKPMSWITGNAMVINTDEHQNKVCKRYLYHYLSAYNFNSLISGSGQPQIVRTPLEQLKVTLPTFLEQKQKATFLDKIQGKIEISNKTLNLYLQQKQYLLRQMFI